MGYRWENDFPNGSRGARVGIGRGFAMCGGGRGEPAGVGGRG